MDRTSFRCFVPGCPNFEENSANATFYTRFPEELQEEWLIAIGRNRDTFITNEVICSDHFECNNYENYDSLKLLKTDALPTLNLPTKPKEPLLASNFHLNTSGCEKMEELIPKYNTLKKSKPIKLPSNAVCTMLKPNADKTCKYGTTPLNTIKVIVVDTASQEQSGELSPAPEEGQSDEDECRLTYEDTLNCRTCLDELGPERGYRITDIYEMNKTLKEMIVYCIPQMATTLVDTDQICSKCLESIKFCANFIENCLKVEAELLENHVSIGDNENLRENVPERYRHILLDHNYIPETKTLDDDIPELLEPSAVHKFATTKHECFECERTFKTKNYLLDHIRRLHSSDCRKSKRKKTCTFNCEFCDKSFLTKLGYDLHLQLSHREQIEMRKEAGGYNCKECGSRFSTFGDLTEHKLEEHGVICKICSMRFDTMKELNCHYDTHPSDHLCHICGKGFKNKGNLKTHMLVHNDTNTYLCHKCGQGFKSQTSLGLHLKRHDPHLKFQCDECPSSFQQRYRLDLHKKVCHLGIREYMCGVCNKKFCYEANLKSHYKLKHSEVKPYQCEQCGIRFARSDYLKRHTHCGDRSKHGFTPHRRKYRYKRGDPALITCKLCDKVFKDVQMLRLHVKTHTKVRKYKCRTCNLTFTTGSNRDRHEKVHESSSFRCEVCFKKMETQEALEEHRVVTHENSKKYKCHVCEEVFGRKYLLHSHVAERHGDVEDFEKEGEVLYKVVMQDYLVDE